jgi:hypothetical protein
MPSEKNGFTFRENNNGAIKNMRHDSTKCKINLLNEIQEKKVLNQPKNKYLKTRDVINTNYHVTWKVSPNTNATYI